MMCINLLFEFQQGEIIYFKVASFWDKVHSFKLDFMWMIYRFYLCSYIFISDTSICPKFKLNMSKNKNFIQVTNLHHKYKFNYHTIYIFF